jgi:hypothetical protein
VLRAYRLIYPDSPHAPPHLWECEQPYIEHLLTNAHTFGRWVVQRYFRDWGAYATANARIWRCCYLPKPLYQPWATWEAWLVEYRPLVIDVQAIYTEAQRMEIHRLMPLRYIREACNA